MPHLRLYVWPELEHVVELSGTAQSATVFVGHGGAVADETLPGVELVAVLEGRLDDALLLP